MAYVLLIIAAVAVAALVIAFVGYRLLRRDPPGSYDAKPMHPGFRSNRGRGR